MFFKNLIDSFSLHHSIEKGFDKLIPSNFYLNPKRKYGKNAPKNGAKSVFKTRLLSVDDTLNMRKTFQTKVQPKLLVFVLTKDALPPIVDLLTFCCQKNRFQLIADCLAQVKHSRTWPAQTNEPTTFVVLMTSPKLRSFRGEVDCESNDDRHLNFLIFPYRRSIFHKKYKSVWQTMFLVSIGTSLLL